jgi:hypothetical protein
MRNRYLAAAGTSLSVFIIYVLTLSPSVAMWDAGEYLAAVKSLGIPHQPANPLFVLIGHVAGMLPLSDNYAMRINVLAAFASAVTAGFWFLCAERVLRDKIDRTWERFAAAAVAALLGATAFTVWNQSVAMEKVYPVALVGLAIVSWLVLQWFDATDERRQDRLLVLVAYVTGLTYAVHPAGMLTGPATLSAVLSQRPRTLLRWKLLAVLVGAFLFGTSPFAFLPIRAAHQPAVNVSAVSACEAGRIELGCTFSMETARRLKGVINREQYPPNPMTVRRAPFTAQLEQYWMYFSWQWMRDSGNVLRPMQSVVTAAMFALGLLGLAVAWQRKSGTANGRAARAPNFFWYFGPLTFTFTLLLIVYLNFRYSYGQSPELGNLVDREPRERDYFYMWTFSLWGLLAGLGLMSFKRLRLPLLAFALLPLVANWRDATRAGQTFTRHWGADMLAGVEPNAVVITNGDNDSFPLWYAQAVEGLRPDVTVALTPYLGMEWYARQLNRRSPLWHRTDQELDTIPGYAEFREPQRFVHGAIDAVIPPGYLSRDQLLVLLAIKDTFPNRPIYFSLGNYPHQLGLGAYVKRVGLLLKLEPTPIRETPDTVRLPSGFVDLKKSLALWDSFGGPDAVRKEGRWLDKPSDLIPLYYAMVAQDLAQALQARGDSTRANAMMEQTRTIVEAVR